MIMEPSELKNYLKMCKTLHRSEDIPIFPVSERYLKVVKERVNLAREVDKLELKSKPEQSEKGWIKETAEEMDILLEYEKDEEDLYDDDEDIIQNRKEKNSLTTRRQQLAAKLRKPIFPKGYSFRYPTSSGKLELPFKGSNESTDRSAVHVMKEAIEETKLAKKMGNKKKSS